MHQSLGRICFFFYESKISRPSQICKESRIRGNITLASHVGEDKLLLSQ